MIRLLANYILDEFAIKAGAETSWFALQKQKNVL